jgi:hypothetical protein
MGNYNPHAPYILGEEWVPIRQPNISPDNVTEYGYRWSNGNTVVPVSGCYYIAQVPDSRAAQSCDLISVYPDGFEERTGPIKLLSIPVSAIAVTGTNITTTAGFAALNNSSDDLSLRFQANSSGGQIAVSFDTASYSQQLFGKRILDVKFRYSMAGAPANLAQIGFNVGFANDLGFNSILFRSGAEGTAIGQKNGINELSITDLNPFWQAGVNVNLQRDIFPWRYQELNRFASTEPAASRMVFNVTTSIPNDGSLGVFWYFCDLQITYCEEQRVKYGGRRTQNINVSPNSNDAYNTGPQMVKMVGTDFTAAASLAAGDYVTTIVHNDLSINVNLDGAPLLNAIRELYQLPNQRGMQMSQSLTPDKTFTVTGTSILPQLTLHHTGGVVTGSHAYGIRYGAPVYGAITAIQEIEDDVAPVAATQFPQVRFYARRFGDTTTALRLIDVASGTFTVSITVADFDALPEIVDGWKEVTLRFASPPSFSVAAGDPDWRWDSVGETAGNQWQVLVASATSPAAPQSIGPANYLAPIGDTNTLTWMSPSISGTAADTLSDAVLIFSQDPPTITGFALSTATQQLTGFALQCSLPKSCIPTGVSYNQVSWSAQTALPVTGFGYYELQRMDTVDLNNWQTIMKATTVTVTGFRDYEARVGIQAWYRLRSANVLDFRGAWVTGSSTLPSPGVSSPLTTSGNSMLIFTSNKQPGSNLAYRMQFEGSPVEQFVFPEAEFVQLQQMFGKDFYTAFHPLERGGERFQRTLLVSAAAISLKSMANFNSLRDLGWADLPYVCVRDELGNRWYATILIPGGTVRRNRKIYMAQIEVVETSATPYPVNP